MDLKLNLCGLHDIQGPQCHSSVVWHMGHPTMFIIIYCNDLSCGSAPALYVHSWIKRDHGKNQESWSGVICPIKHTCHYWRAFRVSCWRTRLCIWTKITNAVSVWDFYFRISPGKRAFARFSYLTPVLSNIMLLNMIHVQRNTFHHLNFMFESYLKGARLLILGGGGFSQEIQGMSFQMTERLCWTQDYTQPLWVGKNSDKHEIPFCWNWPLLPWCMLWWVPDMIITSCWRSSPGSVDQILSSKTQFVFYNPRVYKRSKAYNNHHNGDWLRVFYACCCKWWIRWVVVT